MQPPKRNRIIYTFFSWYISRIIRTDFSSFTVKGLAEAPSKSVLLLANHFSWWDGFFLFHLNRQFFRKHFHIMVSEDNYNQVKFLKYLGAFSVKKQSRSMVESLEYAGRLLNDPENMVVIFPQGKLHSNHVDEVLFQKGLLSLINSSSKEFQYVFAAGLIDYFEERKPAITYYLQQWEGAEFTSLQLIKNEYNKHYQAALQQQTSRTV